MLHPDGKTYAPCLSGTLRFKQVVEDPLGRRRTDFA